MGVSAVLAAVTTNSRSHPSTALAKVAETLAGRVVTTGAGHLISPLALCGETSQNICGSEAWVTPRFGLAPTPVQAEAGALNQRIKLVAAASSPPICDGSAS